MKMKLFCFLLAIAISSKSMAQDTTFYIKSFCVGFYDKHEKVYKMRRRFYNDFEIRIKDKNIIVDDGFNTKLEIVEKEIFIVDCQNKYSFYCKDNEGAYCFFLWGEDTEKYCQIMYDDTAYFYFTKN